MRPESDGQDRRLIKLGLLIPRSGVSGIWAPSAVACAQLATAELNEAGGVLGHHVALVPLDAGTTALSTAEAASDAVREQGIDAIVGMFASFCRRPVSQAINGRVPFIYTPQFEGFETDATVVTTGETSRELLAPALRLLSEGNRDRRYFLCGNDYMWPRASVAVAHAMIQEIGRGVVTGEMFLPLGSRDYDEILSRIAATRSDVVMPFFLGADAIHFNRAFCEAGLVSQATRFACAVDETIVYGTGEARDREPLRFGGLFRVHPLAQQWRLPRALPHAARRQPSARQRVRTILLRGRSLLRRPRRSGGDDARQIRPEQARPGIAASHRPRSEGGNGRRSAPAGASGARRRPRDHRPGRNLKGADRDRNIAHRGG